MEDDFVGAIKIKDGLFIGDEYAAQDFEFVVTNKVTHIINCAGKQVPNYWETVGVAYLTYDWMDSENQIVFDTKGEVVKQIYDFIEEAVKLGEGVLVHSLKGQSRSCCVLTAYFMKRYHWSLYKTLEFLTSRRSDLEIRTSFYHQLLNLESRLFQQMEGQVTANWFETSPHEDHEEMLLRNTFLNARSAPFDEHLVNPPLTMINADHKNRRLNWVDEKHANKIVLASYFNEKPGGKNASKPGMSSIRSILKGSNKSLKVKTKAVSEEETASSSKPASSTNNNAGLRSHKSVKTLAETRTGEDKLNEEPASLAGAEKEVTVKSTKSSNMQRSSSACYFEREENAGKAVASSKASFVGNDKPVTNAEPAANTTVATKATAATDKANSNLNGNIIHLTVNNYLAPVNNVSGVLQPNSTSNTQAANVSGGLAASKEQGAKPNSASQGQIPRAIGQKFNLSGDGQSNEIASLGGKSTVQASQPPVLSSSETPNKSALSTNQLKSAIEKKLSKEFKSQTLTPNARSDFSSGPIRANPNDKIITTDTKNVKVVKDYARPTDIKVNYQVLLKSRETPPPRKREDAKKIPESPQKKATSKSFGTTNTASTKGAGDSGLPYSSYLNSLFSTSFSHLNTITPSYQTSFPTTDKKTPISTKSSGGNYNLTLSQKAQTLTRPQRATTANSQSTDKVFSSSMVMSKSKQQIYNEPPTTSVLTAKYNNYITGTKTNPVRITYDKTDNRPHSATPDRAATPQGGLRRIGTPTTTVGFTTKTVNPSEQRLSAPSKNHNKHAKKDSGSTQDILAKYRQRTPSPSQMGYNPVLSSSMNVKSKKY